jgi:DNA repair exonuclease SbcCD ATPase subunit
MITRVTVQEFRGISGTEVFTPEILTILTGRNGLGKTTFFDAIDWCLFGDASRFGSQGSLIKNLYRSESHPSVEVTLRLGERTVAVARTENGVSVNGTVVNERELAETLIVDPEVFPPYLRELGRQVRTVTYLPQEQIREFVTASLSSERKALLRGLLGVPNAGIVESGIKHVRDHFSVRERNLIEDIETLDHELRQLATTVEYDPSVERDASDFLTVFRGQSDDGPGTIESVRSTLEENLSKRENDVAGLENTIAAYGETTTTVAQADKEIATLGQRRAELLSRADDAVMKVKEVTTSINAMLLAQQNATRDMVAEEARVSSLSLALSKKDQLEALAKELAKSDREHNDVVARSMVLKRSAEALQLDLDTTEKLADEYRVRMKLAQERAAIEVRRTEVEKRLGALHDDRRLKEADLSANESAQAAISKDVAEALTARDKAAASHEMASRSAQRAAQIADLCGKLAGLIDKDDSDCPLCGADYGTYAQLREHVFRSGSISDIDDRLRDARSALSAAETAVLEMTAREKVQAATVEEGRIALDRLDRELAQLQTQYDSLTLSLGELGDPADVSPSSDILTTLNELRANVQATELAVSQLESELRTIDNKRSRIATELEELRSAGALMVGADVSVQKIEEARQRVSQARKDIDEREQLLRKLRDSQATLESGLSDRHSQIAGTEGRLNAERERKRRVLEEFERQCQTVGLIGVDFQAIGTELHRRAERLRSEIAEIRNAIARARGIERRQIINENAINQRDRQKRLAEAQENLSMLGQAQNRFDLIAEKLEARSRIEADSAGAQHLAAIQKCVNDLYPHRHLNEVYIDFAEGELLVKDRWLRQGVRPQDYSSTGQANVLALSVFLGLALRQTFSYGRFLLLDEPVQNLDDLHFLAFLTLLKRIALSRQVIISTADSNIAEVLRRQLRSWSVKNRRWCEYEWVAFQPESGPTIRRRESRQMAVA